MNSTQSRWILLFPTLVSFLLFPSLLNTETGRLLRAGVILPLSGPAADLGRSIQKGLEMGLDAGGRDLMKLTYEDDQFIASKTVAAFNKLLDIDKVDLVIAAGSTPGHAIAPLAEEKKIPLIVWAADPEVVRGRKYVLRSCISADKEAEAAAAEALRLGYQKIGMLITQSDYSLAFAKLFSSAVGESSITHRDELPVQSSDFRPNLSKAMSKGMEAFMECMLSQQGLAVKQLRQLGFKGPVFGCASLAIPEELKRSEGALGGGMVLCSFPKSEMGC